MNTLNRLKSVTTSECHEIADRLRFNLMVRRFNRESWLISIYQQENGMWLSRVSSPRLDDTVEGLATTRCGAVDMAVRGILIELGEGTRAMPK